MKLARAELRFRLVGWKNNAVYIHVLSAARLGLSLWLDRRLVAMSDSCWLLAYLRLHACKAFELNPHPLVEQALETAAKTVQQGIFSRDLSVVVEGLESYYSRQLNNGAAPLPSGPEFCKVYTDYPFAVYLKRPTKRNLKKYHLV